MVKLSRNRLRLRSGKIVKFKSKAKRDRFERVAQAVRHGWKPKKRRKR